MGRVGVAFAFAWLLALAMTPKKATKTMKAMKAPMKAMKAMKAMKKPTVIQEDVGWENWDVLMGFGVGVSAQELSKCVIIRYLDRAVECRVAPGAGIAAGPEVDGLLVCLGCFLLVGARLCT